MSGAGGPNYETDADAALAHRLVPDSKRVDLVLTNGRVRASGNVVGYYDHPSFVVQLDDGTTRAWSARLVREVESNDAAEDDEEAVGMARWMAYWESLTDADRARELQMMAEHDADRHQS